MPLPHCIANTAIGLVLAYALGILAMVLGYARATGYKPEPSEYLIVPLLMAAKYPLVALLAAVLCVALVCLCWRALARRRA